MKARVGSRNPLPPRRSRVPGEPEHRVKFLCDRCRTRYSIGDDRVRGKILKIRCKSCQNVITVREGMAPDPEAVTAEPGRLKKATPGAPAAADERSASPGERAPGAEAASQRAGGRELGIAARSTGAAPARLREPAGAAKDPASARRTAAADAARPAGEPDTVRDRSGRTAGADAVRGPRGAEAGAARGQRGAEGGTARGPRGAETGTARGQAGGSQGSEGSRGESVHALNAAFASAMASPPPALEEEWYVSIDGEQEGPFALVEAQHWVAQQPFDAELHCWSEGFDDWLPVDKVSHFRGLRKRPTTPAAPPPLPRAVAAPRPSIAAPAPAPVEDEPKPLFAATMASLERGAPPMPAGLGLPTPLPPARATPPLGSPIAPASPARPNGAPGAPGPSSAASAPVSARPERRPEARAAIDDPFDLGDLGDSGDGGDGDGRTQLEAMPFDEASVEPRPLRAGGRPGGRDLPPSSSAAVTAPHLPASSTLPGTGANAAVTVQSDFGSDDELHIGEVSRVVKLGDVVRTSRGSERLDRPATRPGLPGTGRSTGISPSLRSTGMVVASVAPGAEPEVDPAMTMAPVRRSHRRGLIALLIVAAVLVLGGTGAVILFVTIDDETTGGSLGTVRDIDTSRPEDPVTHRPIGPGPGPTVPTPPIPVPRPARPRPGPATGGSSQAIEPPAGGNSLGGDEIEDVARRHQDMTQRCYMRSQRGADAIIVGDVKKIAVTLTVDRDGNVTELQLSDHAADVLGRCLSTAIRGWKFRQSPGGTFRFSLNFVSG